MLHIKLKGMEHINIVLTYTLHPRVESKGQNFFWKWSCCISNKKERSVDQHARKTLTLHTPLTSVDGLIDIEIVQTSIFLLN